MYKKNNSQVFCNVFFILNFQEFLKVRSNKTNKAPQTLTFVRGQVLLALRRTSIGRHNQHYLYAGPASRLSFSATVPAFPLLFSFDTPLRVFEVLNLICGAGAFLFFSVNL